MEKAVVRRFIKEINLWLSHVLSMKVIYYSDFYLQLVSLGFHTLGRIFNKIALKKIVVPVI